MCDIKVQWELQRADTPDAFKPLSRYFDVTHRSVCSAASSWTKVSLSAAPTPLYGEPSNSPKLFTEHTITFHIWNHQRNWTTTVINVFFFYSNSVIKSLFLRLDQPVQCACVVLSARLRVLTISEATGTFNGSCSDALTLPISDWLFHSEGGASCDWAAILSVAFFPIQNYNSDMS